jgi:hypothetical protein
LAVVNPLTGTPKQTAWAERLRERRLIDLRRVLAWADSGPGIAAIGDDVARQETIECTRRAIETIENATNARPFIDHKDLAITLVLRDLGWTIGEAECVQADIVSSTPRPNPHGGIRHIIRLECIGPEEMGSLGFRTIRQLLGVRGLHEFSRRPWVAEIVGVDPVFGFERRFLHGDADFEKANSTGSRGVYLEFVVHSFRIYEVKEYESWRSSRRYFVRWGLLDREELSEDEVRECLKAMP